jgi:copper chaperone CopZ
MQTTITLKVSGMTCEKCSQRVHDALMLLGGVKSCHVDLTTQSAKLVGQLSQLNRLDFERLLEETGYPLVEIAGLSDDE